MWLQLMNRFNPFRQEGEKPLGSSAAYRKKQLDLLNTQKSLYMDMLRQSREHVLKGDLNSVKTCYQNYISESMNVLQQGLNNHVEFYKTFPVGLSSVAETYGDFVQNIFEKMGNQNLITPFTQSTNKSKLKPGVLAAMLSSFFLMPSAKATEILQPMESALHSPLVRHHYQPAKEPDLEETQKQFQKQFVDLVSSQITEIFKRFQEQKMADKTKSFKQSEFLDLQQALLDSFTTIGQSNNQQSGFEKALQEGKKKLKHVPEEKKNVYFNFLESQKNEILEIAQQLRKVPEAEKNSYAKSLSKQDVLGDEFLKISGQLRKVQETEKNLYGKSLSKHVPAKDTVNKPNLTTAYLDTLKELKSRFSKDNEQLANRKIVSLNEIMEDAVQTSTGRYLQHAFQGKDMETSLDRAVNLLLKKIKADQYKKNRIASQTLIDALNQHYADTRKEVTDLCREIIINESLNKDSYVFYHGHGNNLRLYMDMLREIKSYEVIDNLEQTNPLRDKSVTSPVKSVDDVLSQYEDATLEYAARNNLKAYDDARTLGVGFAPDKIEFFRDHAISVNINLFGNLNTLAECTLFYFLDSFNISDPNENLLKNLITRISPSGTPTEEIQKKTDKYKELYMKNMKETGGNLMQIFVKKDAVDQIGFASWMKGIPVWLDKETQKIATRGGNQKAVPVLTDKEGKYQRPLLSEYIDLFRNSPDQFIEKFSDFGGKDKVRKRTRMDTLDRPQARLIIDPEIFSNKDTISIKQYTRFKPKTENMITYQSDLKKYVAQDVSEYLQALQGEQVNNPEEDKLIKLIRLMKQGQEFEEQQGA